MPQSDRDILKKPLEQITIHDLRYLECISFQRAGSYMYHGRVLWSTKPVVTMKTAVGNLSPEFWVATCLQIVERDGLMDLLAAVKEHVSILPFVSPSDVLSYSLSCLACAAWKHWEDFSPSERVKVGEVVEIES